MAKSHLQLTRVICAVVQEDIGDKLLCIITHDNVYPRWQTPSPEYVLVYDYANTNHFGITIYNTYPCGRIWFWALDETINYDIIELDGTMPHKTFSVPLAQPDAFEQIESRLLCKTSTTK